MRPLLKMFGGKGKLTKFIIGHFPENYENMNYFEPFIGGGSVFLSKKKSKYEHIADIDKSISDAFTFIKTSDLCSIRKISYTKENFNRACKNIFESGVSKIIKHRFSRSGRGDVFSYSARERGNQSESINSWQTFLGSLDKYKERLKDTVISHGDYSKCIVSNVDNFYYLDPPYLPSTRVSKNVYKYDWTEQNHVEFLELITKVTESKILVSGYESALYNDMLSGWNFYSKDVKNNSGEGKTKNDRKECLWSNY